jgi:hypothetical protein
MKLRSTSSLKQTHGPTDSPPDQSLFYVYFPNDTIAPHQKKTVKYDPKATLYDALTKECAKRDTTIDDYYVWDSNGNPISLQVTLDHPLLAKARMVVLNRRYRPPSAELAAAAWDGDLAKVQTLLEQVKVIY